MKESQYGVIEPSKPKFEPRALLRVPHREGELTGSHPFFGPNTYHNNLTEMERDYSCLPNYPKISFRESTTFETISALAYEFEKRAKPEILDPTWAQLGRIIKTQEGVFTNPNKTIGNPVIGEQALKSLLDRARKIRVGTGHIYLCENDFAFAEYNTFETGVQDSFTFTQGGLAKVLEHTETTRNLQSISSPNFYKLGVNVWGFDPVEEPVLRVAGLNSVRVSGGSQLGVNGYGSLGNYGGYAFGVLKETSEAGLQKSE